MRARTVLWSGFVLVHVILAVVGIYGPGWQLGDVEGVYVLWAEEAAAGTLRMGIDVAWVYPIGAAVPIGIAGLLGPDLYVYVWLGIAVLLNAAAFAVLLGRRSLSRPRTIAASFWLVFLLALGPVSLGRIDAITVPFAITGLLWAARRPHLAGVLLTIAAWVKVWPAALVATLVIGGRGRVRVVIAAAITSAAFIVVSLFAGSGWNVFGFITQQTGRGIQVESIFAVPTLWRIAAGDAGSSAYYDHDILTFQVVGPGIGTAIAIATPLLALVVAVIAVLGVRAALRGATFVRLVPPLALALVVALILVNKVGSPQFVSWIAVPVILGICLDRRRFELPAILALVISVLTQVIYPYTYAWLLAADPLVVGILTLRALLEAALLGWAVVAVWRAGSRVPSRQRVDA